MNESRYTIAEHLKSPIAIISDRGDIHWFNRAFESSFGQHAAAEWLHQGVRAVGGERGWLQDFFLAGDEQRRSDECRNCDLPQRVRGRVTDELQ